MDWREDLNHGKDQPNKRILKIKRGLEHSNLPILPLNTNDRPLNQGQAPQSSSPYVSHMVFLSSHTFVAGFSSPSDSFALFNTTTGQRLRQYESFNGHAGGITDLKTESRTKMGLLFWSSGVDGLVKRFDARVGDASSIITLSAGFPQRRPFTCMDPSLDGNTVVAGTDQNKEDASIVFWDVRNPSRPSQIHTSTHSEDITTLAFDKIHPSKLLSGSMDGLLSITNVLEPDEDEAILQVANWGCSIAKAGWIGGKHPTGIWSTSDMETMSLWSEELDLVHDFGEIKRENTHDWYADYVLSTKWIGRKDQSPWDIKGLVSWWGTNDGNVSLLSHDGEDKPQNWTLQRILKGGHDEVVRCICWDAEGQVIVTGGEDGKICVWSSNTTEPDEDVEMIPSGSIVTGSGVRRRRSDEDDTGHKVRYV